MDATLRMGPIAGFESLELQPLSDEELLKINGGGALGVLALLGCGGLTLVVIGVVAGVLIYAVSG